VRRIAPDPVVTTSSVVFELVSGIAGEPNDVVAADLARAVRRPGVHQHRLLFQSLPAPIGSLRRVAEFVGEGVFG
jgi:hypothetical protein